MSIATALETARIGDYIQTYTGRKFWPLDPRPEEIDLQDIAHALSNQCRFSGHTRHYYSVAEHSVRVMGECADVAEQRWGLLHDAAEAYLTDMPRPLKYLEMFRPFRSAEAYLMTMIADRFGLSFSADLTAVKINDNILLATEVRDLMTPNDGVWRKWIDGIDPLPETIQPWTPRAARSAFLAHAGRLGLR